VCIQVIQHGTDLQDVDGLKYKYKVEVEVALVTEKPAEQVATQKNGLM
tara:strand:+ start:43 stop:186 length:144 start_codon:yes stop_codon:yes gene_type:complete